MAEWETTSRRVTLAFCVGAMLIGACVVAIVVANSLSSPIARENPSHHIQNVLGNALFFGTVAAVVSLVLLVFVAGPVWSYLHDKHMRKLWHAMLLGATLLSLTAFLSLTGGGDGTSQSLIGATDGNGIWIWRYGNMTKAGWVNAIYISAWCSLIGAMIGGAIWRVAYRKKRAS